MEFDGENYEVDERVLFKVNGEWRNATIVNGYRTHDGVINVVLEDGSRAFCGDSHARRSECIKRHEATPTEALKDFVNSFLEGFSTAINTLSAMFASAGEALSAFGRRIVELIMTATERHYYLHAKKARVRKKYFNKAKRRFLLAFQ